MTPSDWIAIGVPCATVALAAFGTFAGPLGQYLATRTHNEKLGRITAAAGRYAAETADILASLPAGADVPAIKAKLLGAAADKLKGEFASSAAAIGATDPKLLGIMQGEFAKLPPKVAASIGGVIMPAAVAVAADAAPAAASTAPSPMSLPAAA